jgi:ketosteroid isomerase-like protein
MSQQDFDEIVKEYNKAMNDFFKGNPETLNNVYSDRDDISLAQLSGPFVRGRKQVTDTASRNAMKYREGMDSTFETLAKYVTPELAYVVQVERTRAKVAGSNNISSLALRVTSIFRLESGVWKLLHRHVDSTVPPAESTF